MEDKICAILSTGILCDPTHTLGKSLRSCTTTFFEPLCAGLIREHASRVQIQRGRAILSAKARRLLEQISKWYQEGNTVKEISAHLRGWLAKEEELSDDVCRSLNEIENYATVRGVSLGRIVYPHAPEGEEIHPLDRVVLPLEEIDVVRLVDPLPFEWDASLSLGKGVKVSKGLERLVPPLDVRKLLGGDGSEISQTERLVASNYARELMGNEDDWPLWLRGEA